MKGAVLVSAVAMLSLGTQAAVAAPTSPGKVTIKHVILDWTPARTPAQTQALRGASESGTTVKTFTTTVTDGSSTFTYTMMGKNPFVTQAKPSKTIQTTLIPVIIKFSNGDKWNPTAVTSCDTESAITRVQNSPLFNAQAWSFGATSVGTGEYVDEFQRAEFWSQTKPTGINPGYNTNLAITTHAALTINVPSADSATIDSAGCGNDLLGGVDIDYLDSRLQSYITGTLGPTASTTFPLFVLTNVVAYEDSDPSDCCVLGYHSSLTNDSHFQVYGIADYDTSGDFGAKVSDTSAMSHEVAEAINDPNGSNPTKPWGDVGQVPSGQCQSNLEVGDPLSGTAALISDTLNGFTYHLQELAFFSWFYHSSPSLGVNGWYSDEDTFTTSAAACPPGGP